MEFNVDHFMEERTSSSGTMGQCNACYSGERDSGTVEEFIATLTTFKLKENISDSEMFQRLPLLLKGDASEWWSKVKEKITNFESFAQKLREEFSPLRPAWRIYAEIFECRQQKMEPTASYIRKNRALFAKLAKPPTESDQIDLLFGCLHSQIRERLFRHQVVNFDDLIKYAREIEKVFEPSTEVNSGTNSKPRCSFCRRRGHTAETCLRREKYEEHARQSLLLKANTLASQNTLSCYGCDASGLMRSNCPKCQKTSSPNTLGSDVPLVNVKLFGVSAQAYIDCSARTSVASTDLKNLFELNQCPFTHLEAVVEHESESILYNKYLSTKCKIEVGGTNFDISFLLLPNVSQNRLLLGCDFLEQAGIVLNMGQRYWYFEAHPSVHFDFAIKAPRETNLLEEALITNNSVGESESESAEKRKATEDLPNSSKQQQMEDNSAKKIRYF